MNDAFDIEKLLKEKLLNKGTVPPAGLFHEIERRLLRRKRRRRLFWLLFWIGLGIGACFTGGYFATMFNSECDCATPACDEVSMENATKFIDPVSHDSTKNQEIGSISSREAASNEANHSSSNENERFNQSDSHQSSNRVARSNDVELPELEKRNSASQQLKLAQKLIENDMSEDESPLKNQPAKTKSAVEQIKSASSLATSNVEPSMTSLSPNGSSESSLEKGDHSSKSRPAATNFAAELIKESNPSVASLEISPIELIPTNISTEIISGKAVALQEKTTDASETNDKRHNYGLTAYAGPSFFDIAVFKPYLSSGSLSNRPFKSSGYEFGIDGFRKLNERWRVNVSMAYNYKQSQFLYNLLVSEEDYFNYYAQGELISLDQLDQEENCNCFVANDVQLEYSVNSIKFSLGLAYLLAKFKKINVLGNVNVSTNVFTRFKNNASSIVDFPSQKTESLNNLGLRPSVVIDYSLTENTRLSVSPSYTYLFTHKENSFYAHSLHELTVSLGMTFSF